jgi:hypothetical protein
MCLERRFALRISLTNSPQNRILWSFIDRTSDRYSNLTMDKLATMRDGASGQRRGAMCCSSARRSNAVRRALDLIPISRMLIRIHLSK